MSGFDDANAKLLEALGKPEGETVAEPEKKDAAKTEPVVEAKADPAPEAAPAQTVTINHRGKAVTLPIEKALELASAGFDYNLRNRELADAKAALESDRAGDDIARRFGASGTDVAHLSSGRSRKRETSRSHDALSRGEPGIIEAAPKGSHVRQ